MLYNINCSEKWGRNIQAEAYNGARMEIKLMYITEKSFGLCIKYKVDILDTCDLL